MGKSTLFNRIVGKRLAIVEDVPGVTRDRQYAEAQQGARRFRVVDTGGFTLKAERGGFADARAKAEGRSIGDEQLVRAVREQAEVAIHALEGAMALENSQGGELVIA